jgi:uroporphyrinogen-III synthase
VFAPCILKSNLQVRFPAGWCEIPFYVVGQATASALTNVFGAYLHLGFTSVNVRGQLSGNATTLASFILEEPDKPSSLLYLTGDKNRDTLTHILQEGGISLETLQTYKTEGSSSFAKNLSTAIQTSSKGVYPTSSRWLMLTI